MGTDVAVRGFGVRRLMVPSRELGEPTDLEIVGRSTAAIEFQRTLERFAATDIAVLLEGETGSGKEVAARVLHRRSAKPGRFVPVNMAAIPADLAEAELFGARRGAFTGADRARTGLIDAADEGTLFLDEIGDMAAGLQAQLLRFLESGEVRAVGSTTTRQVAARVVSATHRNLREGVRAGWFRLDLYYRLAPVVVRVPPLRERVDDIPLLRRLFEDEVQQRLGVPRCRWSADAERALVDHRWPGNIRELRHVVEVAVITADGNTVTAEHLGLAGRVGPTIRRWRQATSECRRDLLVTALQRHGGNRTAAARELGISRQTLHYHLRRLEVGGA